MEWSTVDYNEAAEEVFAELGVDPNAPTEEDSMNCVYKHRNGSLLYVGDQRSVRNPDFLRRLNIRGIVNCTHNMPNTPVEDFSYYRFPVGKWRQHCNDKIEHLKEFIEQMLDFVEDLLDSGCSILLHCVAGAHRSGATAVLLVMHFTNTSHSQVK